MQDLLSIHDVSPEANERLLPGRWEGDLLKGARGDRPYRVSAARAPARLAS